MASTSPALLRTRDEAAKVLAGYENDLKTAEGRVKQLGAQMNEFKSQAAKAGEEFNTKEVAILATLLAVLSYVAFIWGLKLQFPVWPSFLTR